MLEIFSPSKIEAEKINHIKKLRGFFKLKIKNAKKPGNVFLWQSLFPISDQQLVFIYEE